MLPIALLFLCAGFLWLLQNPPFLLLFIFLAVSIFTALYILNTKPSRRKTKADEYGRKVWLVAEAERQTNKLPSTAPPSFYEPEKIFRSDLKNKRTDFSEMGNELQTVTLSVETPDEFPDKINSKEPKIEVDIKKNKHAILRFNHPRERNALDQEVLAAIEYVLDEVIPLHNCRTIIFTGTNEVFASGANLNEILALNKENARGFALRGQALMNKIADLPQMTIAAINGYCFGGALDLALACDKRIASPGAVFCHPGISLGIITGWGGTQRLPRLIGEAKALEIFLTAKRVDAKEALQIGLIDEISENPLAKSLGNISQ